jgi:hypothetical protein
MFAEDIGLLPPDGFLDLLRKLRDNPAGFPVLVSNLWREMAGGATFSTLLFREIAHFNGGLFEDTTALPLSAEQLAMLADAAASDWSSVEPSIFGTLLTRALDSRERHKLGAEYTPRSYVECLIRPVILDPLREQWDATRVAAAKLHDDAARLEDQAVELDREIRALGGDATFEMSQYKVRPEQFLGLELSPNAVAIAQLVLWIGYFQWQHRTTGKADTGDRPLLPKTRTIRQQDAVLAYDDRVPRRHPGTGEILTIWNGHTTKPHPVTGKEVPDESARKVLFDYIHPRRAEWPRADYIVGNPPFIGASRMRETLGDGYTEALRLAWKGAVPESADLVMFWWCKAAAETARGRCKRFGFITTNSIHQTFNRRVMEPFLTDTKKPLHLAYAIPDHPWIDSADGAAVRIAMTAAAPGREEGVLEKITTESPMEHGEVEVTLQAARGVIAPNLQIGADLTSCAALIANSKLSCPGVKLHGSGFIVSNEVAASLGLGTIENLDHHLKGYRNGKDLTNRPHEVRVIDLFGLTEEEARMQFPTLYQHVLTHVKPERDQNNRDTYRLNWWIFGEPRRDFRPALKDLPRYIATVETSKHRFFTFLDKSILSDNMLIAIASDDGFFLGVLSSQVHVVWALASGGTLEDRPRYNKTRCFEPFPFPALEESPLKQRIRDLGERLDAHRKRQQALHPALTLTGMYNVLEKLRAGQALDARDKVIHDQGLVTLLKQIHDELDDAVLDAYGWSDLKEGAGVPPASSFESRQDAAAPFEQALLQRLVALNHERAAEERRSLVRWLRPDYQNPAAAAPEVVQPTLEGTDATPSAPASKPDTLSWPARLPEQVSLIRQLLAAQPRATAHELSARFGRASKVRATQIEGILETLAGLGQI